MASARSPRARSLAAAVLGAVAASPLLTACPPSDGYFIRSDATGSGGSNTDPTAGMAGFAGSSDQAGTGGQAGSTAPTAGSAGATQGGGGNGGGSSGGADSGGGSEVEAGASGASGTTCPVTCNAGRSCDSACQSGWVPTGIPPGGLSPRERAAYVSLGNQLFIWGGLNESGTALNSGAIYDPRTDAWRMVASDANTPSPRADATAVWTGAVVVVFGGLEPSGQTALADGALYDPVEDRWRTMSAGPTARAAAFGAFTDEQVLVWAGRDGAGEALAGLEFFDPEADQWREAENRWDEPSERYDASPASGELTFWIFGGRTPSGEASDEAAYYSFTSEEWLQRWDSVDLSARWGGFGAFVDGRYYTWGGRDLDNLFDDGMSYNPLDTWESIEQSGAPSGRYSAFRESGWSLAVDERWFILLGGLDNPGTYRSDGARYDTQAAAWSAIEAWPGSASHAFGAVDWVAGEIVVWGGRDGSALTNTGVRYLPAD